MTHNRIFHNIRIFLVATTAVLSSERNYTAASKDTLNIGFLAEYSQMRVSRQRYPLLNTRTIKIRLIIVNNNNSNIYKVNSIYVIYRIKLLLL